jgi:hypothetical protein
MNKMILFVIPLSYLAVGCVAKNTIQVGGCSSPPSVQVCNGVSANPKVTINTNRPLNANPPNVCADQGTTIVFTITPPGEKGDVSVIPKIAADSWLTGTNSANAGKIEILVPTGLEPESDHDYTIVTKDGQCLDPRVEVQ